MPWVEIFIASLKANDVRLISYVPDNVLTPLIDALSADTWFTTVVATREDEAIGIAAGAWMGGTRSLVLMQTSGFGVTPNAIASLLVPYQIPVVMAVSERGTLGEFNTGQVMVARTMRPTLESISVDHHSLTDKERLQFMLDRSLVQAFNTKRPLVLILSPLLTGGKVFKPQAESGA